MENLIIVIAITILVTILYLIVINLRVLKKVVKYKLNDGQLTISDERYFELNNKIQLLIVVASILILVGGFIGYNSIHSINSEITEDIEHYQETIVQYDSVILGYTHLISDLEIERRNITEILKSSINESNRLQKVLIQLQNDYSFNVRTYMISNIPIEKKKIEGANDYEKVRVYFKDLLTTEGEKLPHFKTPPFISIQNLGFAFTVMIKEINKEYFEYEFGQFSEWNQKTGEKTPLFPISEFDLLITINK